MEASTENNSVALRLNENEALVLFEWLHNFNEGQHAALFHNQAEERILFDLEAELERVVSSVFQTDYQEILARAWQSIRDVDEL